MWQVNCLGSLSPGLFVQMSGYNILVTLGDCGVSDWAKPAEDTGVDVRYCGELYPASVWEEKDDTMGDGFTLGIWDSSELWGTEATTDDVFRLPVPEEAKAFNVQHQSMFRKIWDSPIWPWYHRQEQNFAITSVPPQMSVQQLLQAQCSFERSLDNSSKVTFWNDQSPS